MKTAKTLLLEMLERCERGQIRDVAIASTHIDGSVGSAYAIAEHGNVNTVIGSLEVLKHRLLTDSEYPLEKPDEEELRQQ